MHVDSSSIHKMVEEMKIELPMTHSGDCVLYFLFFVPGDSHWIPSLGYTKIIGLLRGGVQGEGFP